MRNKYREKTFFEKVSKEEWMWHDMSEESYNNIKLPKRGTSHSAGYDFFMPFDTEILPHTTILIPTGIKACIPLDKVLLMFPRSSLGTKFRFTPLNLIGVIDSDYYNNPDNEGHIFMKMINDSNEVLNLKSGQAFCQGIIMNYFTTDDDSADCVRSGGFGSTDNKG